MIKEYKIIQKNELTHNVFELELEPSSPSPFIAGQYLSILVPKPGGNPIRRAYSIASSPEEKLMKLCIQRIGGPGTTYLDSLTVGQTLQADGPLGFLVLKTPPERKAVFISTGTGVAPFRSILLSDQFKKAPPQESWLLLGIRKHEDLLYEIDFIAETSWHWLPCFSQDSGRGFHGRVTQYLTEKGGAWLNEQTDFYLCGNGGMIKEIGAYLKDKGIDKKQIFKEAYFN